MLRKLTTLMTQPITLGKSDNVREVMEETKIKTGEITAIFAKGDPRGFAENYYSFIESPKYKQHFLGMQNDLENFSERMIFHADYISNNLFTKLFSDPKEIMAALCFFLEFITDTSNLHEHANSLKSGAQMRINSSKNGTKMRIMRFDSFFFSIFRNYNSQTQENKRKIFNGLEKMYNDKDLSNISGYGAARGFIGTLIYTISELENNPRPEFVRLGRDGDRYAGFGLRITKRNAAIIFSGNEIKKSQLCFARSEEDIGISNMHFSDSSLQFSRLKRTMNANEEMNWYSGHIEKLSVVFQDNAGAYSWITDSCAYGRAIKRPTNHITSGDPSDKDKFVAGVLDSSTPGPLGYAIFDGNDPIPHFEFTTGGRNSYFFKSPRNLIIGSNHLSQKDDYVLYGSKFEESLNRAFIYRGLEKAFFRGGFIRVFVLSGLKGAHFEDAALHSVFLSNEERKIGENATWTGNSFRECIFFGPQCFSRTLKIPELSQQDSLHGIISLNGALHQRNFSGKTLEEAQLIGSISGSTFEDGTAAKSIIFPKSIENSVIENGAFFLATIFGGIENSQINGGFQSSKLCKDLFTTQTLLSKVKKELKRRTNIGYAGEQRQGDSIHSYNKTCESIIAQEVGQVEAWIDAFPSSFQSLGTRVPFAGSTLSGKDILHGAFIPKDRIFLDAFAKNFPEIKNVGGNKSGRFNLIEEGDIQHLING